MRVAAIDIGTNTALLLIVEGDEHSFTIVQEEHEIPRLGEDVDKTQKISAGAIQRLDAVLARYHEIIISSAIDAIDAVGTSALRDADNGADVIEHIRSMYEIPLRLISGDEEARLTYLGAVSNLQTDSQLFGVIDIGGGSTEIALGKGKDYAIGRSMDVGAVRLTERTASRAEREKYIRQALVQTFNTFPLPSQLVAVAGTPTSIAAIKLGLQIFDRDTINGTQVTLVELEPIVELLYSISAEELANRYPVINKGRADILPSGALILYEAMKYLQLSSFTASTRGLRYGVAINALRKAR